ncbi:MAG: SO_0444 family Cu/Zn efflux transporter [Candidatus Zixiibacteriota bacterium]
MTDTWFIIFLRETSRIALQMAPFIVLGLLAAIGVHALFPKGRIERILGRRGIGSTIKAALAGIPLPLCSCAVVPMALSLKKRGASDGATISFLVSTPETGLDSIAVTYALINPLMTILRPIAAFISAVCTGLLVELLPRRADKTVSAEVESCAVCGEDNCETGHSWWSRLVGSFRYVLRDFFPDIANWLVLGMVISGALATVLPNDIFVRSGTLGQMAMVIGLGVPLYICASASTPIAAVLLAKGMTPGAALVFLLVGPATNIASWLAIARLLGRRQTVIYLAVLIVTSVALGLIVNAAFGSMDWTPKIAHFESPETFTVLHWVGAALLLVALISIWSRQLGRWRRLRTAAVTASNN